ncbi:hypothetical protein OSTOST_01835 [Ostertagia ostertagi]
MRGEGAFSEVVADLRRCEMRKVRQNAVYQSLVMGLFWSSGKLIVLFAALCYVFTGNELTAERIFVATALYNACCLPVTLFLPFSLQFFFEVRVSVRRIQMYLRPFEKQSRILVTHQIQFLHHATKVLLMKNGDVVAVGTLDELKNNFTEQFEALIQETGRSYAKRSPTEGAPIGSPRRALSRMSEGDRGG